jgi:putative transposase
MGRKLRVEYSGAIYHVMNRGDRREPIFRDDADRQCFLKSLAEACQKTGWRVLAYCLMHNHFHLVIETPQPNLVAGMKWLLSTYTARFNRRHKYCGHLFSGRYKALIVDGSGSGYLKAVCDYVHLNPGRAGLVSIEQPLLTYRWSSWPAYVMHQVKRPGWLCVERLLGEYHIPSDSAAGRRHLEVSLEQRRAGEAGIDYKEIRRGWFIGDSAFKCELLEQMRRGFGSHHEGEERREAAAEHAERVVAEELKRLGWTDADLELRPKGDCGKVRLARRLRRETTMSRQWIASRLHMGSISMVAHCLRQKCVSEIVDCSD